MSYTQLSLSNDIEGFESPLIPNFAMEYKQGTFISSHKERWCENFKMLRQTHKIELKMKSICTKRERNKLNLNQKITWLVKIG